MSKPTASTASKPTRATRLNAIVARMGTGAGYVIHTVSERGRRIVVTNPETGDAIGAVGDDIDQAIDALDAKVPTPKAAKE